MKIVIADGMHEADYIIGFFNNKDNDLVIINEDPEACKYLSDKNDLPVMLGRCTRENELIAAGAENCDIFVPLAISDNDMVKCRKTTFGIDALCRVFVHAGGIYEYWERDRIC